MCNKKGRYHMNTIVELQIACILSSERLISSIDSIYKLYDSLDMFETLLNNNEMKTQYILNPINDIKHSMKMISGKYMNTLIEICHKHKCINQYLHIIGHTKYMFIDALNICIKYINSFKSVYNSLMTSISTLGKVDDVSNRTIFSRIHLFLKEYVEFGYNICIICNHILFLNNDSRFNQISIRLANIWKSYSKLAYIEY